jgi:ribosome biogenesis protein SSF1/2
VPPPPAGTGAGQAKAPQSLVVRNGRVSSAVTELVLELRQVMGPYTAARLKERRTNRLKDYTAVAGQLGITHLLTLSQSSANVNLRIARYAQGPTLTFKVQRFCLRQHVRSAQARPIETTAAYRTQPLVVLNNFADSQGPHVKLMKLVFQNMFPSLDLATVKLSDCRRVVLYHLDEATGSVEQRHYAIRAAPTGLGRSVKRLIQARVPDLGQVHDISDYIVGATTAASCSDSEMEDEAAQVILPDRFRGRGNMKANKSAIQLAEIGPRLTLKLMKVERGFMAGDVIYHEYIKKSPEEVRELESRSQAARELKKRRRDEQERNVARKRAALGDGDDLDHVDGASRPTA